MDSITLSNPPVPEKWNNVIDKKEITGSAHYLPWLLRNQVTRVLGVAGSVAPWTILILRPSVVTTYCSSDGLSLGIWTPAPERAMARLDINEPPAHRVFVSIISFFQLASRSHCLNVGYGSGTVTERGNVVTVLSKGNVVVDEILV
jgi:hypothetical protein